MRRISKIAGGLFVALAFTVLVAYAAGCSPEYEIVINAEPAEGGKALGAGTYTAGEPAVVTALAAPGYSFIGWASDEEIVSTFPVYEFAAEKNILLVALFERKTAPLEIQDSEKAGDDEEEPGGGSLIGEEIIRFPMKPVLLTSAPGGRHLYFYLPSDHVDSYLIICMESLEYEVLPTPGLESGQVAAVGFDPDSEKIAYYALSADNVEEVKKGRIYIGSPGLPLEIEYSFAISSSEMISDNDFNHHRRSYSSNPAWSSNREAIYYFTTGGLHSYSLQDKTSRQLFSRSGLEGLFREGRLAPHAFQVNEREETLVYLADGEELVFVNLTGDVDPERDVVKIGSNAETLEYIFGGKYLALHSERLELLYGGGALTFYNPESAELVKLGEKNYSYAFNEHDQLLVLAGRSGDSGRELKLYDENLNLVKSVNVSGNFSEVVWLEDQWGGLVFDTLYPLHF